MPRSSPLPRSIDGSELIHMLVKRLDFVSINSDSHVGLRYPSNRRTVSVQRHPVPIGTLRSLVRQVASIISRSDDEVMDILFMICSFFFSLFFSWSLALRFVLIISYILNLSDHRFFHPIWSNHKKKNLWLTKFNLEYDVLTMRRWSTKRTAIRIEQKNSPIWVMQTILTDTPLLRCTENEFAVLEQAYPCSINLRMWVSYLLYYLSANSPQHLPKCEKTSGIVLLTWVKSVVLRVAEMKWAYCICDLEETRSTVHCGNDQKMTRDLIDRRRRHHRDDDMKRDQCLSIHSVESLSGRSFPDSWPIEDLDAGDFPVAIMVPYQSFSSLWRGKPWKECSLS